MRDAASDCGSVRVSWEVAEKAHPWAARRLFFNSLLVKNRDSVAAVVHYYYTTLSVTA
jgi:hypothetical protein